MESSCSSVDTNSTVTVTGAFTQPPIDETTYAIPPDHPFRTLVLCFDGTGDQFDADNSNIVQFFAMLPKADRKKQMVYYQTGLGTYTVPEIATPLRSKIAKLMDKALAWNLDAHVMGGYEFLMQNYTANDRICIFGFSRGAYTARCLAGMLNKIPFAYKMYTDETETGWDQSNAFKKTFSIDVDIEFLGVWDTVDSVGLIPRNLPWTTSNAIIRTFRHAVSLDERRVKFKPSLWDQTNTDDKTLDQETTQSSEESSGWLMEHPYSRDPTQPTDADEVWFSGCHCDVGGGSVENDTEHTLARIPLRWIIRECFKTHSGIMFECEGLRNLGIDPAGLYPHVKPRPPPLPIGDLRIRSIPSAKAKSKAQQEAALSNYSNTQAAPVNCPTEEEQDLQDALAPVYDVLGRSSLWWILEFLPLRQYYECADETMVAYIGWNMGRGRLIPKCKRNNIRVHRSVKTRLEVLTEHGEHYKPKAAFDLENTTWVD
ncbi:hypothetical protein FB451DRAFT_1340416 [Mycena latifolia]|nr:hypothetical protein FB451DRAFT_1340416 [Mycena latifolia]